MEGHCLRRSWQLWMYDWIALLWSPFLYSSLQVQGNSSCRVHHLRIESYIWPGSCTVESLLISSCQIFQAAFIFKKWASQQMLHGLLWGPAFTGCICCISIAPFTQVGFAAAHTRAESVEGLPQLMKWPYRSRHLSEWCIWHSDFLLSQSRLKVTDPPSLECTKGPHGYSHFLGKGAYFLR